MSAQGVGDLYSEFILHELHYHCLVVNRVSSLTVWIQAFDLAFRTVARGPQEKERMPFASGVLNGGQSSDTSNVGIGVLVQVDDLFIACSNPILSPEDRPSLRKHE